MKKKLQPEIEVPRTTAVWVLDVVGLLGVLFMIVQVTLAYGDLPPRVATHFGAAGEPDGWGDKKTLLLGPLVAVAMFVLLTVLGRTPHRFNYPMPITEANAKRAYALGRLFMTLLKTEIVWVFAVLWFLILRVAHGQSESIGVWFLPMMLGVVFATVIGYLWYSRRVSRDQ